MVLLFLTVDLVPSRVTWNCCEFWKVAVLVLLLGSYPIMQLAEGNRGQTCMSLDVLIT